DGVVGAVRSALQFAAVPAAGQTAQLVIPQGREVRIVPARQLQAEPLAGDGTPILDPGIADIPELETGDPRQLPGHILGIQIALFDQQPQVLALPAQLDIEDLGDPEVLRLRLEHRPATGLAVGPRPQPLAVCAAHRASASTATPSLRPSKPGFSVVVALILTCSSSTCRSSATSTRMLSMCGASFGAWAAMVTSTLPTFQPLACTSVSAWRSSTRLS